jgi:hypothetical protein
MTIAQLQKKFPDVQLHSEELESFRKLKLRNRINNPTNKMLKMWKNAGIRINRENALRSPEEKAILAKKAVKTYTQRFSPQQRSAHSKKGGIAAHRAHPNLASQMGKAGARWRKSVTGRAHAAKRARRYWATGIMEGVAEKNRQRALEGRIPFVVRKAKPTINEQRFLALIERHNIPLRYVGNGTFRIPTPTNSSRAWRNPDFVSTINPKHVVLLDAQTLNTPTKQAETNDYIAAGYQIMRVTVRKMSTSIQQIKQFLGVE